MKILFLNAFKRILKITPISIRREYDRAITLFHLSSLQKNMFIWYCKHHVYVDLGEWYGNQFNLNVVKSKHHIILIFNSLFWRSLFELFPPMFALCLILQILFSYEYWLKINLIHLCYAHVHGNLNLVCLD